MIILKKNSSHGDILSDLKKLKPEMLFFVRDQSYNHSDHYGYWLNYSFC